MVEEKKMNFFTRIITSIKDFEKYPIFATEKIGTAIKYLVILMIIFSSIISIAFTIKFKNTIEQGISYFKKNIKEITYIDSNLSVNSRRRINNRK